MLYVYFILYSLVIRANDQNQTTIQISTKNLFNNGKNILISLIYKKYIALVYRGCWYIAYHKNNATLDKNATYPKF